MTLGGREICGGGVMDGREIRREVLPGAFYTHVTMNAGEKVPGRAVMFVDPLLLCH
jgi:hypothetical protein